MKRIWLTMTIMALVALLLNNAEAGDRRIGGMIIGGSTGAIVGQAIGRNAESTIIGAAVGGVTGLLIGSELHTQHRGVYHPAQGTVYKERHGNNWYDRRHRPVMRDGYRPYQKDCRKIVTIKNGHYRTKRVVTTVCENRPQHRDRHGFNGRF